MCCGFRIFGIVLAGENVTLLFVKHFFSKGQLVSTVTLTQRRDSPERAHLHTLSCCRTRTQALLAHRLDTANSSDTRAGAQ